MSLKYVKGNLITLAKSKEFDVIVHGCNCFCTMGAGLAKSIKEEFPSVYEKDCETVKGDRGKLGNINSVYIKEYDIYVVNAYTQYNYGKYKIQADYDAIKKCFIKVKSKFGVKMGRNMKFGIPKIGCGLGGLDWTVVSEIVDSVMVGEDVTVVEYS